MEEKVRYLVTYVHFLFIHTCFPVSINKLLYFLSSDFGNYDIVKLGNISIDEKKIPDHIKKPPYYYESLPPGETIGTPEIKTEDQIKKMRKSCNLAANILKSCKDIIKVGTTTEQIDDYVHNKIISHDAYPSPLRYAGFPKSVCTSVNNVACHGIPDDRPLFDGDIINVDITVYYDGYHGDCSKTFLVGNVDERGKYLVECTEECLNESIKLCGPGKPFNIIGKFIEAYTKEKNLNSIYAFIGHGIGSYFHGPPEILHFCNVDILKIFI